MTLQLHHDGLSKPLPDPRLRVLSLGDNDPESWSDACEVDRSLRLDSRHIGLKGTLYLHRSLRPLEEAPIEQADVPGFDFDNECEGMCGL